MDYRNDYNLYTNREPQGTVVIPLADYERILADAVDGMRLKSFIEHKSNSYYGVTREEVATLCKMFGLEQEDEE